MASGREAKEDRRRSNHLAPPDTEPPGITVFRKSNAREFKRFVTGADVEVIEVKRSLDRVVLGQAIIGADLLEMEYEPHDVTQVDVCADIDPLLEAVCERRGTRVWTPE